MKLFRELKKKKTVWFKVKDEQGLQTFWVKIKERPTKPIRKK